MGSFGVVFHSFQTNFQRILYAAAQVLQASEQGVWDRKPYESYLQSVSKLYLARHIPGSCATLFEETVRKGVANGGAGVGEFGGQE
ncbi:hypothetical protein DLJ54_06940 [Corynebacterium heidelbergense]|uniref:Uncharacterized protein n=1 Tax=Corynebacterium heidelbergense TaxID=2055947 RepID=A0A364V4Z4_9CORY|nr:hypothetical protein DLJ54_06940 [Corynebacterium heidelbergense]